MSEQDARSGQGAGGHGRRRTVSSADTTTANTQSFALQDPGPSAASRSSRPRSKSSAVPSILLNGNNQIETGLSEGQNHHGELPGPAWRFSTGPDREAIATFESPGAGLGIDAGPLMNVTNPGQQSPPPSSSLIRSGPQTELQDPMVLDYTPYQNYMATFDTPGQTPLQPQSPGFGSPAFGSSPALGSNGFLAANASRFSGFSDLDCMASYTARLEVLGSAASPSRDASPRPSPTPINTRVFGSMPSYYGSEMSGSNADYEDNALMPSPQEHPYSSAATSPMWNISNEGPRLELSPAEPCLPADAMIFGSLSSPLSLNPIANDQDPNPPYNAPLLLYDIPVPQNQVNHLVPAPPNSLHIRRTSDPNPRPDHLDIPTASTRLSRSLSRNNGRQSHQRGRSRSRNVSRSRPQDSVPVGYNQSSRVSRSPIPPLSPTLPAPDRGRRQGPMTARQRQDANNRRTHKDTCIGCKVSKIKCDPSSEVWGACAKCSTANSSKPNGPGLCGIHQFTHRVQTQTLDYTTLYYITPPRLSSATPSRIRLSLPHTLNLHVLRLTFGHLLASSFSFIRVSSFPSSTQHLYDIDLQGSLNHLSNDLPPALISTRPFSYLINNLSSDDSDGWISCLRPCDQPSVPHGILNVLHPWTTQEGCFSYSLVGPEGGNAVKQLNPETAIGRDVIIAAAQVSRIITRKVEKIGLEHLQRLMPSDKPETRPSYVQPPEPSHVRLLGQLALGLRFRSRLWSRQSHSRTVPTTAAEFPSLHQLQIPPAVRSDCILACHQIARSLYVLHCWLARFVPPQHALSLTHPSTEISVSRYPGTGKVVQELMSRGETETGFSEWWNEGDEKVEEAEVEAVVIGDDESGGLNGGNSRVRELATGDVTMGGAGLFI